MSRNSITDENSHLTITIINTATNSNTKMPNLLYVPDIAHFTVLGIDSLNAREIPQKIESVRSNYENLENAGIPLEEKVMLLSIDPVQKAMVPKSILTEAGFQPGKYPLLQLFESYGAKVVKAFEGGPLDIEFLYRQTSYDSGALCHFSDNHDIIAISTILGNLKSTWNAVMMVKRCMNKIQAMNGIPAEYADSLNQTIEDLRNSYIGHVMRICRNVKDKALKNDTYGVDIYPAESSRIDGRDLALIETPHSPGSYITPRHDSSQYPDKIRSKMEKTKLEIEIMSMRCDAFFKPQGLDKALETIPEPKLLITDVYAREVFPEINSWDLSILNKEFDIREIQFL